MQAAPAVAINIAKLVSTNLLVINFVFSRSTCFRLMTHSDRSPSRNFFQPNRLSGHNASTAATHRITQSSKQIASSKSELLSLDSNTRTTTSPTKLTSRPIMCGTKGKKRTSKNIFANLAPLREIFFRMKQ